MKFSACWIAKNEEKNILRSINSVKDVVDELVVIDTGSTDDTVKISREAGARVEFFEWIGDFSAARNYALSQVSGEIVFFLDADEWFPTALNEDDRRDIEQIFRQFPDARAIQLTINNLNGQGAVKTSSTGNRILLNAPDVHYERRIHEQFMHTNGAPVHSFVSEDRWKIDHCGYVEEIFSSKMSRNVELLEKAVENATNPEERHFQRCYLVREYFQLGNLTKALESLKIVLSEPDMIRRHCISCGHGVVPLLYFMLIVARQARDSVSRRELHRKIVEPFRKNIEDYPGTATIELYFDAFFDIKDDLLLAKIAPALEAARKIPDSPMSYYHEAEAAINNQAAQAAFRRGKLTAAMEYAVQSFKHTENQNSNALHVLLSCLRGQKATDIILFLNSQFDLNNPEKLDFLSAGTRVQGFRDVHAYYLDKRIQAGIATKGDYLYLLILYGKYTETVDMAKTIHDGETAETVSQIIFLAAICGENESIFRENRDIMGEYADILEAYFAKKPLESATGAQLDILNKNYGLIALGAGMERADAFSALFAGQDLFVYTLRTQYCIENGLFELALAKQMPDENNDNSNCFAINAMTMVGRLDEAFAKIKTLYDAGRADEPLLRDLAAIAERATGALKTEARSLYDRYMPLYDKLIDLRDIINTGYIVDDSDKKKAKALKSVTLAQFTKQLSEDSGNPHIIGQKEICARAADIFEEKGMPSAALECRRLALTDGADEAESYAAMSRLFDKIGNTKLAAELAKKAKLSHN